MLSALYVCKPRFLLNRIASMFLGVLAIVLMGGGLLRAQVVATYTFNDGTADGWTSFNGSSTPTASSAETDGGASFSLLTETNPTNGQGGPSINLTTVLQAGAQYTITGFVRLATGEHAGHGQGGDTKKVAVVAGRRRRGWYGDGSGGGMEMATGVVRRRRWRWHGDGDGGGTERAVVAAWRR